MSVHHIWLNANPEYREQLRRANEERAAAFYAAWKAVARVLAVPFRGLAERLRWARRARRTYLELHALSDRQLQDIGLTRGEIAEISALAAERPPEASLTIAELRGVQPAETRTPAPLSERLDARRGRPAPWVAKRPVGPRGHERAAG